MDFFKNENNISVVERFNKIFNATKPKDKFETERKKAITIIVSDIINNPIKWDDGCSFNILSIGDKLLGSINDFSVNSFKEEVDDIASSLFRFLIEYSISNNESFDPELEYAKRVISDGIDAYSEDSKKQIDYAFRDMILSIFKMTFNGGVINNFKDISSLIEKKEKIEERWEEMISTKQDAWEKEISDREGRVNEIKNSLNEYKNGFNFVGLYDGFHDLFEDKKNDLKSLLNWLKLSVVFIISPIIFELLFIVNHSSNITNYREAILFSLMPILSLVVIATYFFRVLLSNYKSVKSQIMQIELRMTLCRFIQSYADYSAELKGKNETTLNKFEEIIFSNILSTDGVALSAFDGMEKFSGLINSTKK
jgi:ABC-type sugar transport system permease subunit